MHGQRLHIHTRRDGEQDVPRVHGLAHHKFRPVGVKIALTFLGRGLWAGCGLVDHGLDHGALCFAEFRCV